MKVTAFIRKTSAKNNVTDLARVYFRVRDIGGVDIKAASELSINPNHWSAEKQGYKPRVALVSEEKRMNFDRAERPMTAVFWVTAPVAISTILFGLQTATAARCISLSVPLTCFPMQL